MAKFIIAAVVLSSVIGGCATEAIKRQPAYAKVVRLEKFGMQLTLRNPDWQVVGINVEGEAHTLKAVVLKNSMTHAEVSFTPMGMDKTPLDEIAKMACDDSAQNGAKTTVVPTSATSWASCISEYVQDDEPYVKRETFVPDGDMMYWVTSGSDRIWAFKTAKDVDKIISTLKPLAPTQKEQ